MYKKIQASSELVAVQPSESDLVSEETHSVLVDKYRKVLEGFSKELKAMRLSSFTRLDVAIDFDIEKHAIVDLPKGLCRQGCFYVLKDDIVIYVKEVQAKTATIDRIALSRIGGLEDA